MNLKYYLIVSVAQRKFSAAFYSKYAEIFSYFLFRNFNPLKSKRKLVIDFVCVLTNEAIRYTCVIIFD